jgi:hypothetical protein
MIKLMMHQFSTVAYAILVQVVQHQQQQHRLQLDFSFFSMSCLIDN